MDGKVYVYLITVIAHTLEEIFQIFFVQSDEKKKIFFTAETYKNTSIRNSIAAAPWVVFSAVQLIYTFNYDCQASAIIKLRVAEVWGERLMVWG